MTREGVVAAVGDRTTEPPFAEPMECEDFSPERAPAGLMVMIEAGRLSRITLMRESEIPTSHGFRVGDEADRILATLGDSVEVTPHKYISSPAVYLTIWEAPPGSPEPRGIVYEAGVDGRVTHIHAGGPSIQYVEGCL